MSWVLANIPQVEAYLVAHLLQVVPAVLATFVLSLPLARLAQRVAPLRALIVSGASLMYAIPSLALFVILPLVLGTGIRDVANVVVALTLYGLALLVPTAVEALEAVDQRVRDAATAVGMGPARRFLTVELPLAGPAILAGLRVVTVSTVSLTTVGAVLGVRSLGWLFTNGFQRGLTAEILTGLVVTVLLALVLDGLVVLGGRVLMPWTRGRRGGGAGAPGGGGPAAGAPAARKRGGRGPPPRPRGRGGGAPARPGGRMNYLESTVDYILDASHWTGATGLGVLTAQHVGYSLLGVGVSAIVGLPLGWWVGHTGRGRGLAVAVSGAVRALPTLGLITLFGLALGIGLRAPLLALVILALPSVLAGAYTGSEAADQVAVDGARASGMSEAQVLTRVEIPLGAPQLVGGLRSASLQVIATATLAAYTGAGGLGRLMFLGLKTQDYTSMLVASLLVVVLALVSEAVFSTVQRAVAPAGTRHRKDS